MTVVDPLFFGSIYKGRLIKLFNDLLDKIRVVVEDLVEVWRDLGELVDVDMYFSRIGAYLVSNGFELGVFEESCDRIVDVVDFLAGG